MPNVLEYLLLILMMLFEFFCCQMAENRTNVCVIFIDRYCFR